MIGSSVSQWVLDAEDAPSQFITGNANAASDYLSFTQSIISPHLLDPVQMGGKAGDNALYTQGFIFDYCGDTKLELETDITDHYAESNIFIQDHAVLKPRMVTLRGFVGELVARKPTGVSALLNTLSSGLTAVPGYLGSYTPGAVSKMSSAVSKAQDINNKVNSIIAKGNSLLNLMAGNVALSRQADSWRRLEAMWANRIPFTVSTPMRIFPNMLIKTLSCTQPEETKYWMEMVITLKEIRVTSTAQVKTMAATAQAQSQNLVELGQTQGTATPNSVLSAALGS